jgi:hypothetical protein
MLADGRLFRKFNSDLIEQNKRDSEEFKTDSRGHYLKDKSLNLKEFRIKSFGNYTSLN